MASAGGAWSKGGKFTRHKGRVNAIRAARGNRKTKSI